MSTSTTSTGDNRPIATGSVLVPIGVGRRLGEREAIKLDGISSGALASAPSLRARAITRDDENAALAEYGMSTSHGLPAADF